MQAEMQNSYAAAEQFKKKQSPSKAATEQCRKTSTWIRRLRGQAGNRRLQSSSNAAVATLQANEPCGWAPARRWVSSRLGRGTSRPRAVSTLSSA